MGDSKYQNYVKIEPYVFEDLFLKLAAAVRSKSKLHRFSLYN